MSASNTKRAKDPVAIKVGNRIKQARKMAGYKTQAALQKKLPKWTAGRVGFLEAGYTIAHPDEIQDLARVTAASPCWILFGIGPIGSAKRDLQAVRYQNLHYVINQIKADRQWNAFLNHLGLSKDKLNRIIENPFGQINDKLARQCEKFMNQPKGWLDEQHIETDALSKAYPDDMRELMTIYSEMGQTDRQRLLLIARDLARLGESSH